MTQTVRMIMYPETRTAEIILKVCRFGQYMTAGTTEKFVLLVSDSDRIRQMTEELSKLITEEPHSCLRLVMGGRIYKFDMTLWPDMLECLNDFFSFIDDDESILNFDDDDPQH